VAPRNLVFDSDWEPHSYSQRAPLLSNAQIIQLTCGRRWGKSEDLFSWLTGIHPDAGPGNNGAVWVPGSINRYTAPTYSPNCAEFYDRVKVLLKGLIKDKSDSEMWVKLRHNDAEIQCHTLEKYENLRGLKYDRLGMDEKATTPAKAWYNVLASILADPPERCVRRVMMAGTARGQKNWTYKEHLAALASKGGIFGGAAFCYPTWARPGTERYVEQMRVRLPSNLFDQELGAEFLADGTSYFRKLHYTGERPPGLEAGARYTAGVDLAHANDMTVVLILRARPLPMIPVALLRFGICDWALTKARVVGFLRAWDADALLDATPGGSPGEVTVAAFGPEWKKIKGFDSRTFAGAGREDMLKNLALALEAGPQGEHPLLLPGTEKEPHFPELTREITGFEYKITSTGRAFAEAGVDSDGEKLQDDIVIAAALACYAARDISDPYGSRLVY
jgi:hypothetical protein